MTTNDLPAEVLIQIGILLDGRSLYVSSRVSRFWNQTFTPLIWYTISPIQWHHPTFPFKNNHRTPDKYNDSPFAHCLRRTLSLGWKEVVLLQQTYRRYTWDDDMNLPIKRLGKILEMTVYLQRLEVDTLNIRPDHAFWQAMGDLQHLRVLHLDFGLDLHDIAKFPPIKTLFPLFSRLHELTLKGRWYKNEEISEAVRLQLQEGKDKEKEKKEEEEAQETWAIQRLSIHRADVGMLRYCRNLVWLELEELDRHYRNRLLTRHPPLLRILAHCPNVRELRYPRMSEQFDFVDMEGLREGTDLLRSLSIQLEWQLQVQWMCSEGSETQDGQVQVGSGQEISAPLALPHLEKLEILGSGYRMTFGSSSTLGRFVSHIFENRPTLTHLLFSWDCRVPFTALVSSRNWACTNLVHLKMTLSVPDPDRIQDWWRQLYIQIGRLANLEVLEITSEIIKKEVDSGMVALKGATSLRRLSLAQPNVTSRTSSNISWTHEEVMMLLEVCPMLESFHFRCIDNCEQFVGWLKSAGKAHIYNHNRF
ncbi:hypothetical protein BGX29_003498 [Mortierella sp. GBA35]|nr:hypothetical protein BGX29_003498 [Mortierella sp. GBA35]